MCGIFGVIEKEKVIDKELFKESLLLLKHRGPDNQNADFINDKIGLGHVRLSILDLDERSNQPFEFNNTHLIFNGEIFNYIEIKKELETLGYNFVTTSDTEVVIKAFDYWGSECVKKFNGMWAFLIYLEDKNEIFVSRDRFGIKPLYYSFTDGSLILSSEIKSIINYNKVLRKPNKVAINSYLRESLGGQSEQTWFESVYRLMPAHNIIFKLKDSQLNISRYWNYPKEQLNIPYEEAIKKYKNIFKDAVRLRMRSDVPIGLTLSSGLDSMAIASSSLKYTSKNLESFTASFPNEKYDEFPVVERYIKNKKVNANRILTDYSNYVGSLNKLIYHLEAGHSSPAIVPLQSIMNNAKNKVTVLLEGQGADELLGGYTHTFIISYLLKLLKNFKFRSFIREIKLIGFRKLINSFVLFFRNNGGSKLKTFMRRIYGIEKVLIKKDLNELKKEQYYRNLNDLLLEQHKGGLVNLLHYGDSVSMMYSLESRLPFLDYRLVEFLFKLPFDYKYKLNKGKIIHRDAFKNDLPSEVVDNTNKIGFVSPIKEIISSKMVSDILLSETFFSRNIVNVNSFKNLYKRHINGDKDYSRFLYRLLSVELWYRMFIDENNSY
ncbi:asparagine synthase (glutamine-hydrolyzing) [Aureibaculum marinum]|uniref:asparagine synthase (glutamine-hydrolyzing) n=2 Tax=Pseudomonadati TaxID=3379134 RepID=A0A3N4N8P6_9FLAO|nr:asparagine synthase (glutamine-hydrolyzing) [Aureibaculum marinum]RPD91725.1 asparagine synthase (glutamine-hydrolyzing) [Aureibaculum marinum]